MRKMIFFGFPENSSSTLIREIIFPKLVAYFKGKNVITNKDFDSSLLDTEKGNCVGGVFLLFPENKLDYASARLAGKLISLGKIVWVCDSMGKVELVENMLDFLRKSLTEEETEERLKKPY
jgi:hypothetical protein